MELVGTETGWLSPEIGTELWPKLGKGPYAQQDLEVMKGFSVLVDFQMSGGAGGNRDAMGCLGQYVQQH